MSIFLQSAWTVFAFVFFMVIVFWAWSSKRKDDYNKAARMALDDDKSIENKDLDLKA